jgi:carbon-monoxide dehydrogenase small subunit
MPDAEIPIRVTVNGVEYAETVPARMLLSDFLRHRLRLTGTHVGCEHGVCGACTVLVDGRPARSCLTFAVQVDGAELRTIEGLAGEDGLHPVQQAFHEAHGMQCGFCTPGFVMSVTDLLERNPHPSDEEVLDCLSGSLCRCTGYASIVEAVRLAEKKMAEAGHGA